MTFVQCGRCCTLLLRVFFSCFHTGKPKCFYVSGFHAFLLWTCLSGCSRNERVRERWLQQPSRGQPRLGQRVLQQRVRGDALQVCTVFFTVFKQTCVCVCVQCFCFFVFFTFPFLFQRDFPGVVFHQESGHGIVRLNATNRPITWTDWVTEWRERERVVWLLPTPAQLDSTVAHSGFTFTYLYGFSRSAVDWKAAQQDVGTCEWWGIAEKSGKQRLYHSVRTRVRTPIHSPKMLKGNVSLCKQHCHLSEKLSNTKYKHCAQERCSVREAPWCLPRGRLSSLCYSKEYFGVF